MHIRPYEPGDAPRLSALYRRAVETLGPRHYNAAQVTAWASRCPSPERFDTMSADGRRLLVAVNDDNEPVAFGDLEPDGHIDFFYCAPEVSGTGVAGTLFSALEAIARKRGVSRLHAEVSEVAQRFFARMGFTIVRRRDFDIGGVSIHNYSMAKRLDDA